MNNDSNTTRLINKMKETKIPEVEIASKVMKNVHSFHASQPIQKHQRFRLSPVWIAACALLFISTASVSAATLFKTTWHGIEVGISDKNQDTPISTDRNEGSYREQLEAALSSSSDVWKTISVDEAMKQSPYALLRSQESKFTLVKSFGVVLKDTNYRTQSANEWWLEGFYDIFQLNQSDIVVKQILDTIMTESLNDPDKTLSMTFVDAAWENVEIADDVLGMFRASGSQSTLLVSYKSSDRKVISLEFSGDVTKDDLVTLAKTYLGE